MIHHLSTRPAPAADANAAGEVTSSPATTLLAGFADRNASLFRRIGLTLGDPAAWLHLPHHGTMAIVRDLEIDRVRDAGRVEHVHCPADFSPQGESLDADRETAVAQSVAVCLKRHDVESVVVDRSLPMSFLWQLTRAGIGIAYDDTLGVTDRRQKSADEIESLRRAQAVTEEVMRTICHRIATADVGDDGTLRFEGQPLTSERVRSMAATLFLQRGFTMTHGAIVAGPPAAGDCHHAGAGVLHTGTPIIVDLFPRDERTRYHGDCTRTVVHGVVSDEVRAMHAAVLEAKSAAEAELVAGRTGEAVHQAAQCVLRAAGFAESRGVITEEPSIQHGTGHGIGLEIHEPILLDHGGGQLLLDEVFTVEPGLYGRRVGGVRVEDMLVVGQDAPMNLNTLPVGLDWTAP